MIGEAFDFPKVYLEATIEPQNRLNRSKNEVITISSIATRVTVDQLTSADCGLGGRVHPQIVWAKLRALREGAATAS